MEEKWKCKGSCPNFTKPFGKVMEGNILWAKSDSSGLAEAGVDIGNETSCYVELKAKKIHKFGCVLGSLACSFLLAPEFPWGTQF